MDKKIREFCNHETIYFNSGDYYICCKDCPAKWVACDAWDIRAPNEANRGVGCRLNGEKRIKQE